jgi:hypothetical protein
MTQLMERPQTTANVAPYVRGVPATVVARGLTTRFIPASVGIMGVFALFPILDDPSRTGIVLSLMTAETAGIIIGYGAALSVMRRWLYPDAGIDGRRSVVAGLFSPVALGIVSVFMQGPRRGFIALACVLAGAAMASVMYFPWLRPTPGKQTLVVPEETRD